MAVVIGLRGQELGGEREDRVEADVVLLAERSVGPRAGHEQVAVPARGVDIDAQRPVAVAPLKLDASDRKSVV